MCLPQKHLERPAALRWRSPAAMSLLAAGLIVLTLAVSRARAVEAEWIMYHDPVLPRPASKIEFPQGLPALWSRALEMPQRDLKRCAATAIVSAHQKGLAGLEVTTQPLMNLLRASDQERAVRLAAACALVELDARPVAQLLFEQLHDGDLDMAELVEPALGQWNYAPVRDLWLKRLAGPVAAQRLHLLAIQGLTQAGQTQTVPRLKQLVQDQQTAATVRLAAADALGKLQPTGLVDLARATSADTSDNSIVDRLCAARMLAGHRDEEARLLLAEMAIDPQPSIQTVALGHLFRIDPELIMPIIDLTIGSPDVNVRRWVADALIAKPTPERMTRLSSLLEDVNPDLRQHVCDSCVKLAENKSLRDSVLEQARHILAGEGWRGQEQAILLLVTLDDKSIVDRLLALLDSPRPEVHTTAAWGLSRLEVPTTLKPILAAFQKKKEQWASGQRRSAAQINIQLSHLAQAMGQMNYMPADDTLRTFIPKSAPFDPNTRGAAIWAVGRLHAGQADAALATQLMDRIKDTRSSIPEDQHVGAMCRRDARQDESRQCTRRPAGLWQGAGSPR